MSTHHSVTMITGSAAAGKSTAVIERLRQPRAGRALVVVPSGLQRHWLRERADGVRRVTFCQFYNLANRVLHTTGEPPDRLDDALRLPVVRTLMRDLAADGQLPLLRGACAKHGFVAQVVDLLASLAENEATPATLAAAGISPYDNELAIIYDDYLRWQKHHNVADTPRRLALARDALRATPGLFASYELLVIDGFDQFTPIQLSLIEELTRQIPQTAITLTYEQQSRPALGRFTRTYEQVRAALDPIITPIASQISDQHPTLRLLADQIFGLDTIDPRPAEDAVWIIRAADREREVRAALRRVKHLLAEGTPPEQIALLLRDGGEYSPLLREVASEYELPLIFADGLPLAEVPAINALLETLRLPLDDYPRRGLIDAWRARGIASADDQTLPAILADPTIDWSWIASLLDRAARSAGLAGGLQRLRTALTSLANAEPHDDPDDEQRRPAVSVADATGLLALLDAFAAWLTPPEQAPIATYAVWVQQRTAGLRPPVLAEDEASNDIIYRAWGRFERVLTDLERIAALLGNGPVTYATFIAELTAAIATARYGRGEPGPGSVAVLPVLAARGSSFDHVLLLGLNEGEFPRALPDPPIYTRRERALLREHGVPLDSPDPADEQSIFYEALARARTSITLCHTYLDPSGNPLPPSPYLRMVQDLLIIPSENSTRITAGSVPSFEDAASPGETLVALVTDDRRPTTDDKTAIRSRSTAIVQTALWQHIQGAIAVEQAREGNQPYGAYEGIIAGDDLLAALAQRFGPQHRWSVTQLNDYITCPFIFFGRHVLRIAAQEEPEAALRGSFARALRGRLDHAVLAETVRGWQQAGLDSQSEHAALLDVFDHAVDTVLAGAPERFGFAPDRFWEWDGDDLRRRLTRALRRSLTEGDDWLAFAPAAVEQSFGYGNVPPLRLDTTAGPVLVMGRIDRIDQRADGALAIIDYKSGAQPKSLKATLEGRDVQLPIYIHAVEQVLPIGQGQQVERAAFLQTGSGKHSTPLSSAQRDQASQMLLERAAEVVDSVRAGRFTVQPRDTCPEHCPFMAICRVNLRKE